MTRPIPGHAKTASKTTVPPYRSVNCSPLIVKVGGIALRQGVFINNLTFAQAERACGIYIFLIHFIQHTGAGQAGRIGRLSEADSDGGQEEIDESLK